ncbi:MAG: hypothetical protein IJS94_07795, partial [Clostridia bacterium]|nr:hypothetical protein [Clostridia bacterium]
MSAFKRTLLLLLASSLIVFASCGNESVNTGKTTQTQDNEKTTVETDSEGGWFVSFGEYKYYTNGKEASIVTYLGSDTKLTLPDKYK